MLFIKGSKTFMERLNNGIAQPSIGIDCCRVWKLTSLCKILAETTAAVENDSKTALGHLLQSQHVVLLGRSISLCTQDEKLDMKLAGEFSGT
ncbi:hypothetical protein BFJ63_vAg18596 [Fusarium oxysporum f. sp. narcissi]|uniref:Uncharacterized protein n=1 Tax=Fusarium oxysporum f. sp. narcissi TaxID=451672 RepID=A0A4Q2UWV0_FUSOX|nr:hypothetical protein BFJ63_vAg18596 [Fusarium oxysporum f. sp. narcissi]